MYSNRLQPAFQNLLQRVVRFFHPRSSCTTHISADIFRGRKSLVKPVTWQKTCKSSCSVLPPETMHDDAYIGRRSNNIKCVVHDDLGQKNQTTRYILPRHWLYEWLSQFHSRGTYSVLWRSHSIGQTSFHVWRVQNFVICLVAWWVYSQVSSHLVLLLVVWQEWHFVSNPQEVLWKILFYGNPA